MPAICNPLACELLHEADHRIANHLSLIAAFVRLQSAGLARRTSVQTVEEVQLILQGVEARIEATARVHRMLADSARGAMIDLNDLLHELCAPLACVISDGAELVEHFRPGCRVSADQSQPLAQIVAEVITNAVKYGRPRSGGSGRISAACSTDAAGAVMIEIADNGPGLPEAFDLETDGGVGFRMIRTLGKQLGAAIALESHCDGLCFRLALPAAREARPV